MPTFRFSAPTWWPIRSGHGPWFTDRPRTALAVSVVLFAVVSGLRVLDSRTADVVTMLYSLPIALLAVAFGRRLGLAGGGIAVGLVAVWVAGAHVALSPLGWAARAVPLLLLGGLLGHASDRMRELEEERIALELAAVRHREALEINDTIVQGMTAAKWALQAGRVESGLETLTDTIVLSQRLVAELLRAAESPERDALRSTPHQLAS